MIIEITLSRIHLKFLSNDRCGEILGRRLTIRARYANHTDIELLTIPLSEPLQCQQCVLDENHRNAKLSYSFRKLIKH